MKIHILCNDGSPLGISFRTLLGNDPMQIGCGGSETALLTLCEAWNNRGETVILYNNPRDGWESPFEQRALSLFDPNESRDILIVFRSYNPRVNEVNNCLKIFLSFDQRSSGDYKELHKQVHKTVCISPFHVGYFQQIYGITDAIYIDLPVRMLDFEGKKIKKIKNRFIFSTVPARGIDNLFAMWGKIKENITDASLVITSDYRLWGHWVERSDGEYVAKSLSLPDVTYCGALPRPQYIDELLKAEISINPNIYDELFCVSCSEAQVAGAYTITSGIGALSTTNMCKVIEGDPRNNAVRDMYVEASAQFLSLSEEEKRRVFEAEMKRAKDRFHPDVILEQWDKKVFNV